MVEGQNEKLVRQGLNAPYRKIYDAVEGNEHLFWEVVEEFRGLQINFPVRIYSAENVEFLIINEFNGVNSAELARRYGFSKRWVDNVVSKHKSND